MRGTAPPTAKRGSGAASETAAPAASAANTETAPASKQESVNGHASAPPDHHGTLQETVTACVRQYLAEIEGEPTTDFYPLLLSQVEPPLLREVMAYTRHNQTRAAQVLGLNRATLRKKLRQYDISSDSE